MFDVVAAHAAVFQVAFLLEFVEEAVQRGFGALRQDEVAAIIVAEVVDSAEGGKVVSTHAEGLLQVFFEFAVAVQDGVQLGVVRQGEGGKSGNVAVVMQGAEVVRGGSGQVERGVVRQAEAELQARAAFGGSPGE